MKNGMFRSQSMLSWHFNRVSLGIYSKGKGDCGMSFTSRKILGIWGLNVREGSAFLCPNSRFSLVLGCIQSVLSLAVKMKALLQLMEIQLETNLIDSLVFSTWKKQSYTGRKLLAQ